MLWAPEQDLAALHFGGSERGKVGFAGVLLVALQKITKHSNLEGG